MSRSRSGFVLLFCLLLAFGFSLALFLAVAHASEQMSIQSSGAEDGGAPRAVEGEPAPTEREQTTSQPAVVHSPASTTTLDVAILSPPLAVRDSNREEDGPRIFVVHAVVTNTGHLTATDLVITLDYQEDPANGWVLVPGENVERAQDRLGPGEARHSFWFASYPAPVGLSHQYQITATASNATAVSTSENVFGNPEPGQTVATAGFLDTGNNGQIALSANISVGVAFSLTADYDLGTNPEGLTFSPAGNLDFDASGIELREVSARFHDPGETQETIVANQIYFPSVPTLPDGSTPSNAEVNYTFLTLRPGTNVLCPYLGIDYATTKKYDNIYCEGDRRTVITGTATFDLVKEVSDLQVQESERLTYTLHYSNTGDVELTYAWIWDDVDVQVGQIITSTAMPEPDPTESGGNRVAWELGTVPPAGQPGSSGTVTFAILVDAPAGEDLADGQAIVNDAFFGITQGTLPPLSAVTDTVTSTVMAPTIVATKTDGLATVEDGQALTYTITARNEGSITAVGLSASDMLPDEVVLAGTPSPPPTGQSGQTLSWDALGDLVPGDMLTVTVPVSVAEGTSSFTDLVNEFLLSYENEAGHVYQTVQVTDTTTVIRPAAFVEGHVFEDSDGDGLFDVDESGLAGVQLSLPSAFTPTVTTDSAGYYRFRVEEEGVHAVSETDLPGYISTTPNRVAVDVVLGETYIVNFGDMPDDGGGGDLAAIHGTVFSDEDGDGVWDGNEAGIEGVTVTLDGILTRTTDVYGSYNFGTVAPGLHTVEETDPSGYISTTPNRVAVDAVAGEAYAVNFGDMPAGGGGDDPAAIHGTVFNDEDGDGVWDTDEAGIEGVTVTLDSLVTTTTDAYGSYSFGAVAAGVHAVEETDPSGYISTTPNRVAVDAVAGEAYAVNFGDMAAGGGGGDSATIHGTVFSDEDEDGVWDGDEAGIAGVTVTLDSLVTTTTDAYGSYSFGTVAAGQHTVEETDLPDYISTTPNSVSVTAEVENAYTVNFGDVLLVGGTCAADEYEDDDTAALANPLGAGEVAEHDFCGADTADWHTFTAEPGNVYTITTDSHGLRADTVLSLFDTDGETLLAANDDYAGTTNFSSQIVWRASRSGTYYVRITNRAGLAERLTGYDVWIEAEDNDYRWLPLVLVSTTFGPSQREGQPAHAKMPGETPASNGPSAPAGVIDHCGPDAYEVDDTWELAGAIMPGVAQTHTFDSDPDRFAVDKDFVVLESGPGGAIEASSSSTAVSVLLEVYDANGQALNRSGVDQLSWADPPVGRYYLGVTPLSPAFSCDGSVSYELTVDYTPLFRVLLPVTTKR